MSKVAEFIDKSPDQLNDDLAKLKKEQFNLRFQRASGQLENTARVRVVRRDIARIMTVLGQRGIRPNIGLAKATDTPAADKPKKARTKKAAAAEAKPQVKEKAKAKSEDKVQMKPAAQRTKGSAGKPTKRMGRSKKS